MSIEVGDIVLIENTGIYPNKPKFSLCVLVEKNTPANYCFLVINSQNTKMYNGFKIKCANHGFLKYDSYVSCKDVFAYSAQDIEGYGYSRKSSIGFEELKGLIDHIQESRTITRKYKQSIIESLQDFMGDLI